MHFDLLDSAMATATHSEDVVFLLDVSSSMYRADMNNLPRIRHAAEAIQRIAEKKTETDQTDRYTLVLFGSEVVTAPEMYFKAPEIMEFLHEQALFSRKSALGEGLAAAVQALLKQMRFIGQKTTRIIILSDGLPTITKTNPISIAKIAVQLGIIIDCIRFGPANVPGNLFKKITEATNGHYAYVTRPEELIAAVAKVAAKKEIPYSSILNEDQGDAGAQALLKEIADVPLRFEDMSEEERLLVYEMVKGKKLKCPICYQTDCMSCAGGFFGCGRFCPNCLIGFHLHCGQMWAESQQKKKGDDAPIRQGDTLLFRCVHCFYLMKIPVPNIQKSVVNYSDEPVLYKYPYQSQKGKLGSEICQSCGTLFDQATEHVYQCSACETYMHSDCASAEWHKTRRCPYCNSSVALQE
jgi:hypothetical protein